MFHIRESPVLSNSLPLKQDSSWCMFNLINLSYFTYEYATLYYFFQGGLIAKRLLAYPSTINTTNIAITLAAPLEAPVVTFDIAINDYYTQMNYEWKANINNTDKMKKILVSFGNGARDLLMPAGLTSSNDSYISALVS